MRLAFLGIDDQTLALAESVALTDRDEVAWYWTAGEGRDRLRRLAPRAAAPPEWETLLAANNIDAVVVAHDADQERLADQLRKLVQAKLPLVVSQPVLDSMLVAYEIEMNRMEGEPLVLPMLRWRAHPAVTGIFELLPAGTESTIGETEQVLFERSLHDRGRAAVTAQFTRDADLLRFLFGDIRRMSAHGVADPQAAYANLHVELTAPALGAPIRWNVRPADGSPGGRLTVLGTKGRITLHMPADSRPWRLERTSGDRTEVMVEAFDDPSAAVLNRLRAALAQVEPTDWEWTDAAKAIELAETIERCLRRGRTVELQDEDYTEAGTFKGTMTSLGCALLLGTLALMFVVMVLQTIFDMAGWKAGADLMRGWPRILLALLCVFLALQGFLALTQRKPTSTLGSDEEEPDEYFPPAR